MSAKDIVRELIAAGDLPFWAPQALDQGLHIIWGYWIVVVAMKAGLNRWWGAVWLPVLTLLPREFVDQWPINSWGDTIMDLTFLSVGGILAGWAASRNV